MFNVFTSMEMKHECGGLLSMTSRVFWTKSLDEIFSEVMTIVDLRYLLLTTNGYSPSVFYRYDLSFGFLISYLDMQCQVRLRSQNAENGPKPIFGSFWHELC